MTKVDKINKINSGKDLIIGYFILICIITRGLRFFLVAYLTYKFGQKIGPFLDKEGAKWSIIVAIILVIIIAGIYFVFIK